MQAFYTLSCNITVLVLKQFLKNKGCYLFFLVGSRYADHVSWSFCPYSVCLLWGFFYSYLSVLNIYWHTDLAYIQHFYISLYFNYYKTLCTICIITLFASTLLKIVYIFTNMGVFLTFYMELFEKAHSLSSYTQCSK